MLLVLTMTGLNSDIKNRFFICLGLPLQLTSQRKESTNKLFIMYQTSFLVLDARHKSRQVECLDSQNIINI